MPILSVLRNSHGTLFSLSALKWPFISVIYYLQVQFSKKKNIYILLRFEV